MEWGIAIAEPSPVMRSWYRVALSHLGAKFDEAGNGQELLDLVAEHGPYDLIVCSQALPIITGAQVLTMIRTAGDETPFVLVAPFCRNSIRASLAKLGNAALLDDALAGDELLRLAKMLMNQHTLAA